MESAPGSVGPLVVKLGGSVITRKREAERVRPKILRRLSEEVSSVADTPMVLLHGAGSFGHPGARKFGLARPPEPEGSPARRSRGAAIVSAEVRRLHLLVLRELVRAGAAPWSIPVANHARNREGRLVSIDLAPFRAALERSVIPVSFGDVVPDDAWGWSILSADTIAVELARELPARRVVFVSDVPGILRARTGGKPSVFEDVSDAVVEGLRRVGSGPDVTGGIRGKAEAMRAIAATGVDAGLISGLKDGELSRALRGEFVYGSWAHARPPGPSGRGGN
ncbi:MAG: isopentenyl phosphate kinase family protein [Thermoplasmata archaeon]|jgi:isopentenyl phosphate kinase|nr:isopentenyl phosphate kinase family protein [Thermoplasmata archaeon]